MAAQRNEPEPEDVLSITSVAAGQEAGGAGRGNTDRRSTIKLLLAIVVSFTVHAAVGTFVVASIVKETIFTGDFGRYIPGPLQSFWPLFILFVWLPAAVVTVLADIVAAGVLVWRRRFAVAAGLLTGMVPGMITAILLGYWFAEFL